jgi:hypothetical protein
MTIEEIDQSLPNGFHDSTIHRAALQAEIGFVRYCVPPKTEGELASTGTYLAQKGRVFDRPEAR